MGLPQGHLGARHTGLSFPPLWIVITSVVSTSMQMWAPSRSTHSYLVHFETLLLDMVVCCMFIGTRKIEYESILRTHFKNTSFASCLFNNFLLVGFLVPGQNPLVFSKSLRVLIRSILNPDTFLVFVLDFVKKFW